MIISSECGREFVFDPKKIVSGETISLIKKLLLKQIALQTGARRSWDKNRFQMKKDHFTSFKARLRDGVVI